MADEVVASASSEEKAVDGSRCTMAVELVRAPLGNILYCWWCIMGDARGGLEPVAYEEEDDVEAPVVMAEEWLGRMEGRGGPVIVAATLGILEAPMRNYREMILLNNFN